MTSKGSAAKSKEPGALAKLWLRAYNLSLALGWSYILYLLVQHLLGAGSTQKAEESLWSNVKLSLIIFQNVALLEVVHAAIGIVHSSPLITGFQVMSRVMVVCGVLLATSVDYAASSIGLPIILFAWSVTEIVRYSYYFMNLIDFVPGFLTWLRYTTFIVLYPLGLTGEMVCYYWAQLYARDHPDAWSYYMPNAWNFTCNYRYIIFLTILLYVPIFPKMYLHMFAQRRKMLGTSATASPSKKVT